jgi:hypothetical protein
MVKTSEGHMPKLQIRNFCINKHDADSSIFRWHCVIGWVLRNVVLSSSRVKKSMKMTWKCRHPTQEHSIVSLKTWTLRKNAVRNSNPYNHKVHAHPHISTCKLTVYQQLTFDQSISCEQNFAWLTIMCQSFVFDGTGCGFHIALVTLRIYE